MIAYLEGDVIHAEDAWLVLKVGGIGYKVFPVGFRALKGEELALHIFDFIREDRRELYGFEHIGLLELFERLIDISGVGPRLAQKILASGDVESLQKNIIAGDIGFLTSISGVGKKTAQKIILELKGVLVAIETGQPADQDTLDALISLGYKRSDVADVVAHLSAETPEGRIREALRLLSKS